MPSSGSSPRACPSKSSPPPHLLPPPPHPCAHHNNRHLLHQPPPPPRRRSRHGDDTRDRRDFNVIPLVVQSHNPHHIKRPRLKIRHLRDHDLPANAQRRARKRDPLCSRPPLGIEANRLQ